MSHIPAMNRAMATSLPLQGAIHGMRSDMDTVVSPEGRADQLSASRGRLDPAKSCLAARAFMLYDQQT